MVRMGRSLKRGRAGGGMGRILIALVIAAVSLISYFGSRQYNEITDEVQYIDISVDQEIALGLQAAPQMAQQFGGLDPDPGDRAYVSELGDYIVASSAASQSDYRFEFHLLQDDQTINAFALPGGQIFVTNAILGVLETEGEVAGVLAHEIGHVVARHSAEHMAKAKLTEGLTGAAVMASYDPENPSSASVAQVAALVGQVVNMKFGRDDELESDRLAVRYMADAGYDPRSMIRVMEALAEAGGPNRQPEFFSTHPNPENRIENIREAIAQEFPNGVPDGLIP